MAASFTFRFQKLLDLKEKQERALEIELARLERAVLSQQAALDGWRGARSETFQQMREARLRGDLAENARCAGYLHHVRARVEQCRAALDELRTRREGVREELRSVMQSRKVLENYRDRLRAEFMAEQEKTEERTIELHAARKFIGVEGTP
ncbi:MAG: hypothetical protein AMK73_00780 [Planctomycetes bacterium SM23_32]|nr:MAG: hypothetical protein AMK73_00780 [Planctomycetes bacterium SM23_32]